ncbi:MAG TPA: hypothetical protein VLL05_05630 [Terriglobales bacterium]|nr:hypothetical protein [Terriglobales bacterium]
MKDIVGCTSKSDGKKPEASVRSLCGKPATQFVDGEPSCPNHIEQIYEHQVEDYTSKHLVNNE